MFKKLASEDVPVLPMETLPTQLPGTESNFGEPSTTEVKPSHEGGFPMDADVIYKKNR